MEKQSWKAMEKNRVSKPFFGEDEDNELQSRRAMWDSLIEITRLDYKAIQLKDKKKGPLFPYRLPFCVLRYITLAKKERKLLSALQGMSEIQIEEIEESDNELFMQKIISDLDMSFGEFSSVKIEDFALEKGKEGKPEDSHIVKNVESKKLKLQLGFGESTSVKIKDSALENQNPKRERKPSYKKLMITKKSEAPENWESKNPTPEAPNCSKRPRNEIENSNNDQEKDEKPIRKPNKRPKKDEGPQPPPPLPPAFREAILRLSGNNPISPEKLVIQKSITKTDLEKGENRFSIPIKKIVNEFLTEEEAEYLVKKRGSGRPFIEVTLIEPCGEKCRIKFTRWDMRKENGATSSIYVLNGTWYEVRKRNKLQKQMIVQLWAVRVARELWLTLVPLP